MAGLVAQRVDPDLVGRLGVAVGQGNALVTGTNGKTTTARMLAAMVREAGYLPLANPSGSNLMRGVATALLEETDPLGQVRNAAARLGVFEVDEATVPEAARALAPLAIVFTNLFRDQLDRYGEVDTVVGLWQRTLAKLPNRTTIVLNADDPAVASLADTATGPVLTYGVEDARVAEERLEHASDYRFCLSCGEELMYEAAFYGHVGHWRCESCGRARPRPDIRATAVEAISERATHLEVETPEGELRLELPLAGLYNVENALAAAATALALHLPLVAIESALHSFHAAFGRQERFDVDGREVLVLLGKNPTGLNQVLRTIASGRQPGSLRLLFFLNDGIADGRDISWIWDTDYELVADCAGGAVVSGTRAEELALRLKYADLSIKPSVVHDVRAALDGALAETLPGETLYVVPTYTAMLEVRELLARRGQRRPFWEEQ